MLITTVQSITFFANEAASRKIADANIVADDDDVVYEVKESGARPGKWIIYVIDRETDDVIGTL